MMGKKKYLILKGAAGLGNRLTTLMKAIKYANATGRTLFVDWDDGMFANKGDNAFPRLFELRNVAWTTDKEELVEAFLNGASSYPPCLTLDDIEKPAFDQFKVIYPRLSFRFFPFRYMMMYICRDKWSYLAGLEMLQSRRNNVKDYWGAVRNVFKGDNIPMGGMFSKNHHEDIIYYYDHRPIVSLKGLTDYVEPKKFIQNMIDELSAKYRLAECIGIHVRYTDKKPIGQLTKLYKKTDRMMEAPHERIFLCTDNPDVYDDFVGRYGNRVFQIAKSLPKVPKGYGLHNWALQNSDADTKEKMAIEAIIDMWLLSKVKVLYWQGNSSFSYISKMLKNDPSTTYNWMGLW